MFSAAKCHTINFARMKKLFAFAAVNYFFVFLAVSVSAQQFQTVQNGIEHAKLTRRIKDEPVVVNLLRLDLSKVRLDVVHAMDAAIGTETVSSMATRHGAIAAINAGFFRLDKSIFAGDAVGVLQIDGKLLSESYGNRIALGIINGKDKTEVNFAHLNINGVVGFGVDSEFTFSGINRERKSNEIILYTSDFNRTTLTDSNGAEIILSDCSIENFSKRCYKTEVIERKGSANIPPDGFVISIGKDAFEKSNNILYFARKINSTKYLPKKDLRIVFKVESVETENQLFFLKFRTGFVQK